MAVYPYRNQLPRIGDGGFIAKEASVIGDVVLGVECSIWFGAVIRGDVYHIRIGDRTNVQDNTVIHVTTDKNATIIGSEVTIGHRAILHGCTVEDGCLIGMGSIVMDRAVIGAGSIVGAGALVIEGTIVPPGSLIIGSPAKVKRPISEAEARHLKWAPLHYAELGAEYAKSLGRGY